LGFSIPRHCHNARSIWWKVRWLERLHLKLFT
jgi:hypothetical protein